MNIEVVKGRSKTYEVVASDANGPINLTTANGVLTFAAKYRFEDPDPATITVVLVNDPDQTANTGKALLTLAPAATAAFDPDRTTVLVFQISLQVGAALYVVESGKCVVLPVVDR